MSLSSCLETRVLSEVEMDRLALWDELEALTREHSDARADRLLRRGQAHLAAAERAADVWRTGGEAGTGQPDEEKPQKAERVRLDDGRFVSRWHASRAAGIRAKFLRMKGCKDREEYLRVDCGGCGEKSYIPIGCNHRECPRCRFTRSKKIRKEISRARRALRSDAQALKRDRTIRERLLTLTVPHLGGDYAAKTRVQVLFQAWTIFSEWLRRYQLGKLPEGTREALGPLCQFVRVFEWTEGKDGKGHPHFHVYVHGPFLDHAAVVSAWSRAVSIVTGETHSNLVVDIRAATDGGYVRRADGKKAKLEDELIKYMLKDFSQLNKGKFVDPRTMAQVLMTIAGRRCRQTSSGFAEFAARHKAKDETICRDCGIVGCAEYIFVPVDLRRWDCGTGPPVTSPAPSVRIVAPKIGTLSAQFSFQM